MWIGTKVQSMIDALQASVATTQSEVAILRGENAAVRVENGRLRADMDWFKLRLNQVERERGQLIQAAIGVKIAVPEFVPTYEDPGKALNELPDLSSVGEDAPDDFKPGNAATGEDYSMMPGYKPTR